MSKRMYTLINQHCIVIDWIVSMSHQLLGMRWRKKTFGRRDIIELLFSKLKRRIRQFNICFPTNSPEIAERLSEE